MREETRERGESSLVPRAFSSFKRADRRNILNEEKALETRLM